MDSANLLRTAVSAAVMFCVFWGKGLSITCQICQHYQPNPNLDSLANVLQMYHNPVCLHKAKSANLSQQCIFSAITSCLKLHGNFKLKNKKTGDVSKVIFIIRGCFYKASSDTCSSFPNTTDDNPPDVQQLEDSITRTGLYEISDLTGSQCYCKTERCNGATGLTAFLVKSFITLIFLSFSTFVMNGLL